MIKIDILARSLDDIQCSLKPGHAWRRRRVNLAKSDSVPARESLVGLNDVLKCCKRYVLLNV